MNCSRCGGRVFTDAAGERCCLLCGRSPDPPPAVPELTNKRPSGKVQVSAGRRPMVKALARGGGSRRKIGNY